MKTIICDNSYKNKWNDFVNKNSNDFGLLQKWEWGVFQETLGRKVFRIIVENGHGTLAVAQVIKHDLKLGKTYLYIPRGPVLADNEFMAEDQAEILETLFNEIKNLATKERAIFVRLDPAWKDSDTLKKILEESGLVDSGQVQPKQTLMLYLAKSEDELLKEMKSKTRYNIKVAQKHNIEIDRGEKYFEDFWELIQKTSKRNEITSHNKNYYRKLVQVLSDMNVAELVVAKYEGKVIVANLNVLQGEWCVYLHGASNYEHHSKMAPYLLQWDSIKRAKEAGCKYYDFWGVDEKKWPGITRFKIGFAPSKELTTYIGSWDEVYSRFWYNIYKSIKSIKFIKS